MTKFKLIGIKNTKSTKDIKKHAINFQKGLFSNPSPPSLKEKK